MDEVEVVVAHDERATLRAGEVFVKIDGHPTRLATEVRAMHLAPIPTPEVLWHEPPTLALSAVPGAALGVLGAPSEASPAAWAAAGRMIRRLHEAPLPPWPGRPLADVEAELEKECEWLLAHSPLPSELVVRNREIARGALEPRPPVFIHGDLQITHVFVEADEVTGIIDWSEGAPGGRDVRPRDPHPRPRGAPGGPAHGLRHRRGPRRHPRLVVGAEPHRGALAARARSRPGRSGCESDVLRAQMRESS